MCIREGLKYVLTRSDHPEHISRVHEVATKVDADYYICINGDEPLISRECILLVIPLSAKYLGLKPTTFYNTVRYSLSCCAILTIWGALLRMFLTPDSWLLLFICGALFAGIGLILSCMIVLNRAERKLFLSMLRKKFIR